MARLAPEDKYAGLAPAELLARSYPDLDLEDPAEPSPDLLIERAQAVEGAAMAVKGVTNSEGGGASYSRSAIALAAFLARSAALPAAAQSAERPKPATVPLEEVPPPPPSITGKPEPEPQVTTRTEGTQTIQEYRIHGKLYMMRVTPRNGHPYMLMELKGDGTFTRQDNALDSGVRVPQWVLMEF